MQHSQILNGGGSRRENVPSRGAGCNRRLVRMWWRVVEWQEGRLEGSSGSYRFWQERRRLYSTCKENTLEIITLPSKKTHPLVIAAGRLVCWYVWSLFKDILEQPVVFTGAILSDNWANVGLGCHVSIKIGFIISDWGASVGSRTYYPPDSGGKIRAFQFQGHLVIFENWKKNVLVQTF